MDTAPLSWKHNIPSYAIYEKVDFESSTLSYNSQALTAKPTPLKLEGKQKQQDEAPPWGSLAPPAWSFDSRKSSTRSAQTERHTVRFPVLHE